MSKNVIKVGEYIVIKKQNYMKLHKFNKSNSSVSLGKDTVNLSGVEGCPFFSIFRMIPKSKRGKEYRLELTDDAVELKDEIDIKVSGQDNRNILDDGRSQKLSAAEIAGIANEANKASDIVETLISNSNTFHDKTEFSQEKYLKKKQKKYCEYIEILKPNLRLISEIMYKLEPTKIQELRIDTLSQIMTMSNIHSEGLHLLYDSGSNGLMAAALLSIIGANTNGKLVHMHPGNMSQKQALLAMNFGEEQLSRCISVNIYSVLRQYYQGCDTHDDKVQEMESEPNLLKRKAEDDNDEKSKVPKLESEESSNGNVVQDKEMNTATEMIEDAGIKTDAETITDVEMNTPEVAKTDDDNKLSEPKKPKWQTDAEIITDVEMKTPEVDKTDDDSKLSEPKKPKWHFDNIAAAEILAQKVDSLVIACKEDPANIFKELMQFVKPGRPFVIYYPVQEPLQSLYVDLKTHAKVALLNLTCNWMRYYQVLPERTHPEVLMNNQSGFLLSGYILK